MSIDRISAPLTERQALLQQLRRLGQEWRLEDITKVMSELDNLRQLRSAPHLWHWRNKQGILWGELDWLAELHRLLYDCQED